MTANKFHTFKYDDVLNAENLDKLTENYIIYEDKITKLQEHIEYLLELSQTEIANVEEIANLKQHIKTIYELIAGDNATDWPQDEMIDYIKVLNRQIAEWQDKEFDSCVCDDDDEEDDDEDDEITEEEWCKKKGNYTTDQMNGEEITR